MTGLRIIGAGWVVLFHFQPTLYEAWPQLRILEPLIGVGDFGVPLFFILSGYIIWHNYGTSALLNVRAVSSFLWRRFARLWPVNVATQALAVPLIWWAVARQNYWGAPIPEWYSVGGWLQNVFMVQSLSHPDPVFPWNQPSWTLTAEMVAYFVFPAFLALILATGVSRFRYKWIWVVLALAVAYVITSNTWPFPYRWLIQLILLFAIGVVLRLGGVPTRRFATLAAVLQVAVPVAILGACFLEWTVLVPSLLVAWVWSLSIAKGPGVWLFTLRGFQVSGLSSYSLYMLHWVLFGYGYIALYYFPVIRESLLQLFVAVVLCVVGVSSWITWRFFETPARQVLNRGFDRIWPRNTLSEESKAPRASATQTAPESRLAASGIRAKIEKDVAPPVI